jgi:hypothetical protein
VADEESLEVRTFTAESIPWGDLAFESTAEALKAYFGDSGFGIRGSGFGLSGTQALADRTGDGI